MADPEVTSDTVRAATWTAAELLLQFERLHAEISGMLSAPLSSDPEGLEEGITPRQLEALRAVTPEGVTMRRFSEELGMTGGPATAMADRLVRLGLVERRFIKSDRRQVRLATTVRGQALVQEVERRREVAVEALAKRFVADRIVPVGDCVNELMQLLAESATEVAETPTSPA